MFAERLICPVTTLGPGRRAALWTAGCSKHCPRCISPELQKVRANQSFAVEELATHLCSLASEQGIHRLTVTGGDPLEQPEGLIGLLSAIRASYDDILVYTGFTLEELPDAVGTERLGELRSLVDVLIDGRYLDELNVPDCVLRGSTNQRLLFWNEGLRPTYERYLEGGRQVQNFVHEGEIVSVGIHNRFDVEAACGAEGVAL